jgi:hypothetical protein
MKYWSDIHGLMAVATVLDPRRKMKFLYAMYMQIYGPERMVREVQKVKDLLIDLVKEYENSMEGFGATDGNLASSSKPANEGDAEVDEIFDKYMASEPVVPTTKVCTELDMYLEEELLPRTLDLDVIDWWKVGGFKYTALRKVATDILAIPVTTVASESVFSTSGRIISPNRSRLAPNMVEALMCMQAWARADMLGITFIYFSFVSLLSRTGTLTFEWFVLLGAESQALNALLTCLDDEEGSVITLLRISLLSKLSNCTCPET